MPGGVSKCEVSGHVAVREAGGPAGLELEPVDAHRHDEVEVEPRDEQHLQTGHDDQPTPGPGGARLATEGWICNESPQNMQCQKCKKMRLFANFQDAKKMQIMHKNANCATCTFPLPAGRGVHRK